MKKLFSLFLCILLVTAAAGACAETGFVTIVTFLSDEKVLGQPAAAYEYTPETADEGNARACMTVFLFEQENDMTKVVVTGYNGNDEGRYYLWVTDYETGAVVMSFMFGQFAGLKSTCEDGVDFSVCYSFDGGEKMAYVDTVEQAEELFATLTGNTQTAE